MPKMTDVGDIPRTTVKSAVLDAFLGVDLTSSVVNVDKRRSPDAPNMMPDADGYPAKRPGYHTVLTLPGRIWGAHTLRRADAPEQTLIHAGTKLYEDRKTTGAQLLPPQLAQAAQQNGVTFEPLADGRLHVYGTATADAAVTGAPAVALAAGAYTLDVGVEREQEKFRVCLTDAAGAPYLDVADGERARTQTLDAPVQASLLVRVFAGQTVDLTLSPMLCAGESAAAWEPYTAGEAGEEYAAEVYAGMNDAASCAVQMNGKLWILDGKTYLCFDGEAVRPVSEEATVPLITIAKAPNGQTGATSYQPVNLLTGKRTDSYLGTQSDVDYYLSFGDLASGEVTVETLDEDGAWQTMAQSGYTVDAQLGKVHFSAAPGESPVEGEDNVRITYETAAKAQLVNACNIAILYGVNSALDRVFMTGDPAYPGTDRWSEWNDPAYIGDINYGVLGSDACPIVGYSVLSGLLVAHKENEENGRNAFVRAGTLDDEGNAQFLITNVVQGEGAVAPGSFASISSEPLFLTKRGVFSLTSADVTGEKYAQNRSFYLNGALQRESRLSEASGLVWGRFYVLAAPGSGRLYLLDTERKVYESRAPASSYQLEGYFWTGVNAVKLWQQNGQLRFGTQDGKVCEFWPADGVSGHYNDDGRPVAARWTTPLMNLGVWSNLKTVTGVWVVGQPHARSGGEIYYATDKLYEKLARSYNIDVFDWNDIDFTRWTFNTLDRPAITNARKKAKKVKLFQVRVENARESEPFGIFAIHIHYRVGSKVKR